MEFEWSSDGQQLVAVTNTQWYGGYDDYAYPPGDLVVLHVGRGMVQPLGVRGTNPTWSPDGRFIAFEREGHQGIWVVSSRGGPPWQLHPTGIEPRWSPAGNRLLILDPVAGVGRILKLG